MKLSDGAFAVQMLYRLLKLLMILSRGKSHVYIQSVLMQLLVLRHQRLKDTCAWRMLMGSLSTFNEEAGEISFGMLARSILGDTQKGKFAHLNKLYQQIHFYGQLESEMGSEGAGFAKNGNWRKKLEPEGEVVETIALFVKQIIRQITQQSFRVYSGKPGGYKNSASASQTLVNVSNPVPLWLPDIETVLDVQLQKCKDKFHTFFVEPYSDIWPECRHHPEMPLLQRQDQMREVIQKRRAERKMNEKVSDVPVMGLGDKEDGHPLAAKEPVPRRRRIRNVANSEDDSDKSYSASSDSDEGEDAVPAPVDEEAAHRPASEVYHAGWADIDPENILVELPAERRRKVSKNKKAAESKHS
jgi:hypothetical protein